MLELIRDHLKMSLARVIGSCNDAKRLEFELDILISKRENIPSSELT